jgi:hypothetical protein
MSEGENSTTEGDQDAFFIPPSNQPPLNQNNATVSDDDYDSSDNQEHRSTGEDDNSSNDDDDDDDSDDDDSDDDDSDDDNSDGEHNAEDEMFPEKFWAKRCVEKIRTSQEYRDLSRRWRSLRSSVEAGLENKNKLEEFETEEVLPFVNRDLLFFTELVVQAYIKDALAVVGVGSKNPAQRPPGAGRLPQAVLDGRRGLCWHTFHTLLNSTDDKPARDRQPDIKIPRKHPVRNTVKGSLNLAGRYKKKYNEHPTWGEKLQKLFTIDDDEVHTKQKRREIRGWDERATFRHKTRRLIQFLRNSFGDDDQLANYWKQNLAQMASRYLWAVPYFDKSSFGKPPFHNASRGYRTISIIVPAIYRQGLQQQRARVRLRESNLRADVREWLERQPKVEDSGDGYNRSHAILAAIQDEKSIVEALRSASDPTDAIGRDRLIRRAREIFCHNIRLFEDLQHKASLGPDDIMPVEKIRSDPMLGFNSRRGA